MCTQKWVLQHFSGIVDPFNAFGTYGTILYLAVWKHKVLTKPRVSIVSSFIYPQFPSFLLEQKKGGFFFKFWIIRELINYVKGRHSIGIFVLLNYESVVYVMCQGSIKRCALKRKGWNQQHIHSIGSHFFHFINLTFFSTTTHAPSFIIIVSSLYLARTSLGGLRYSTYKYNAPPPHTLTFTSNQEGALPSVFTYVPNVMKRETKSMTRKRNRHATQPNLLKKSKIKPFLKQTKNNQ